MTTSSRRRFLAHSLGSLGGLASAGWTSPVRAAEDALYAAPFAADITHPLGEPLSGGLCKPTTSIEHPLMAKGVVLRDAGGTYVLCALDLCELCNGSYDAFQKTIADAAGAAPENVAVQTIHQHTANVVDMDSQRIAQAQPGIPTISTQLYFDRMARATALVVKEALGRLRRVTGIGTGTAVVDRVASSRRLRQPDGSIVVRSSSAKDPALRALPEGLIDPQLRTLSLCDGGAPLVQIHYYATHPQSFYGDGRVSYDVPGMARERLEKESGVPQVYFTGCGGNVAMGKYNDGSRQARQALTDRLYDAMARSSRRMTIAPAGRIHWKTARLLPPLRAEEEFSELTARRVVADKNAVAAQRIKDAMLLAWIDRIRAGRPVTVSGMSLGPVRLVNLPGEVFVEYQLWAQQAAPGKFVAVAAYGDCGINYVPVDAACLDRGGYEQTWAFAAPCEKLFKDAMAEVIGAHRAG